LNQEKPVDETLSTRGAVYIFRFPALRSGKNVKTPATAA